MCDSSWMASALIRAKHLLTLTLRTMIKSTLNSADPVAERGGRSMIMSVVAHGLHVQFGSAFPANLLAQDDLFAQVLGCKSSCVKLAGRFAKCLALQAIAE